MSVNGQDLVYGEKVKFRPSIQLSKHCAYETVAQGFNCVGAKATTLAEVGPAVKKLVDSGRPGLLNMIVSVKPTTPATMSMVNKSDDPNVITVPYYDNVPKPYYKDAPDAKTNGAAK